MLRLFFTFVSILPRGPRKRVVGGLLDYLFRHMVTEEISGRENMPSGPCLFICNHLSNADAIALSRALRPRQVFFLAGVKLLNTPLTRFAMETLDTIPIRPNSPDVEALKRSVEMLKSGRSVLIFPEGTRSRNGALSHAKKGAALIAKRAGVPIVPIGLTGTQELLPINDSNMGGEKPRRATVGVRIGKPFTVAELQLSPADGEDDRQVLADAMMHKVAELLPAGYRGAYADC